MMYIQILVLVMSMPVAVLRIVGLVICPEPVACRRLSRVLHVRGSQNVATGLEREDQTMTHHWLRPRDAMALVFENGCHGVFFEGK